MSIEYFSYVLLRWQKNSLISYFPIPFIHKYSTYLNYKKNKMYQATSIYITQMSRLEQV